ncbi:MAG TPA: phosphoribosylglycinamide formyltransferase [Firmicutes bacterium]|nr:phosphoribosylglycinamide formyltransferase [Candidatus Fermentithermobacillaceae bacterium]
MISLGVLVSGRGSNLQAILDGCEEGSIPGRVQVVISNRPGAPALGRATAKGVPAFTVEPKQFGKWPGCKVPYEQELVEVLASHNVDLVVLAGYDRLAGDTLLNGFPMRVINIHPSLLPAFPGLNAQKQALDYGVKVAGASVFFVDLSVDGGPIIIQGSCEVHENDTVESLSRRILETEHRILPEAITLIAQGRVQVHGRKVKVLP